MNLNYPPALLQSLEQFKQMGAWSGTVPSRKQKFEWLHRRFCEIYGERWGLRFEVPDSISRWSFSGDSCCDYDTRTITLRGRLSVITYLHEWGHALGFHEQEQAQAYAVGLFKLIFPEQLVKLQRDGYCLVTKYKITIEEDFKREFSSELAKVVIEHAGTHTSKVPEASDEKLVYALLEILDFDCIRYGCIGGITNKEIKKFLLKHEDEVLRMDIEPPSYIGLLAGVFDFFFGEANDG